MKSRTSDYKEKYSIVVCHHNIMSTVRLSSSLSNQTLLERVQGDPSSATVPQVLNSFIKFLKRLHPLTCCLHTLILNNFN